MHSFNVLGKLLPSSRQGPRTMSVDKNKRVQGKIGLLDIAVQLHGKCSPTPLEEHSMHPVAAASPSPDARPPAAVSSRARGSHGSLRQLSSGMKRKLEDTACAGKGAGIPRSKTMGGSGGPASGGGLGSDLSCSGSNSGGGGGGGFSSGGGYGVENPGSSSGDGNDAVAMDVTTSDVFQQHRYVWDEELKLILERSAPTLAFESNDRLTQVARQNYRLLQQRQYEGDSTNMGSEMGQPRTWPLDPAALSVPLRAKTYVYSSSGAFRAAAHGSWLQTMLCVASVDTATCVRVMHTQGYDPVALNFANARHPGGGYLRGARAQEEDLCRLMPPLYNSLKRQRYPIAPNAAHYNQSLLVRQAGSYTLTGPPLRVAVVSAAMPNFGSASGDRGRGDPPGTQGWSRTVGVRIRAVLHAAAAEGHNAVVLGAFGCGAFANPPTDVAAAFAEALLSTEFRGCFRAVVFAIVDPKHSDAGNLAAFTESLAPLCTDTRAA